MHKRHRGKTDFVADAMLGKLAKWLRVLGYDTLYERFYGPGAIDRLLKEGRFLLSRHQQVVNQYKNAVLIHADQVGAQLNEVREKFGLTPDPSIWFSRCLKCNALLEKVQSDEIMDRVPEYVYYTNKSGIRSCPSCCRFYWQGSHRERMVMQLEKWGFF